MYSYLKMALHRYSNINERIVGAGEKATLCLCKTCSAHADDVRVIANGQLPLLDYAA